MFHWNVVVNMIDCVECLVTGVGTFGTIFRLVSSFFIIECYEQIAMDTQLGLIEWAFNNFQTNNPVFYKSTQGCSDKPFNAHFELRVAYQNLSSSTSTNHIVIDIDTYILICIHFCISEGATYSLH